MFSRLNTMHACDGQTDGQTDRRTVGIAVAYTRYKAIKLIVRTYMLPILDDPRFFDQYAYKTTGSTTGALVDITLGQFVA